MASSRKHLQNAEKQAMEAVWREMGRPIAKNLFAEMWQHTRQDGLETYYPDDFERAGVREEAAYVLQPMIAGALIERKARAEQDSDGGEDDGENAGQRLREFRRDVGDQDKDAGVGQKLEDSTMLRTEAMAFLITELAGEREDVQEYRRARLPGGILTADGIDDYLESTDENEDGELLSVAVEVCDAYGLHLGQSIDLVLAACPPGLRPIETGPPRTGPTVRQMQFSFAPWVDAKDAAEALRRAQLQAAALREYRAQTAEAKREAMARFGAGDNPRRGPRAWRSDPVLRPFRRRPRLDTSNKRISAPEADSLRLFIFVSRIQASGVRRTWREIMAAWNAEHEDKKKRYTNERNLSKIYRRTRAALVAWLPEPRVRLELEPDGE